MDGLNVTVINQVFRQTKAGKVIINIYAEFFRVPNKHFPSMKSLHQLTNDMLEPQNDIDYSPSIHSD